MLKPIAAVALAAAAVASVSTPLTGGAADAAVHAAAPSVPTTDHADLVAANIGDTPTTPPAVWSAADYDGKQFTTNQPDLNGLPKIHAVYMYPSDAPNRFGSYAAYFQAEDRRANTILSKATGMAFRWDDRRAADGRTLQDITVVHAKTRANKFTAASVPTELANAGLKDPNTKYYVWADSINTGGICGQSQGQTDTRRSAANAANGTSYSISWRQPAGAGYDAVGGFCNPVTHELTHALGGVLAVAPHFVSGLHCTDDGNDVMCNIGQSTQPWSDTRPRTYDGDAVAGGPGDDDYLDPVADLANVGNPFAGQLTYWAVNLSRYLCPRATPYDALNPTAYDCSVPNNPSY